MICLMRSFGVRALTWHAALLYPLLSCTVVCVVLFVFKVLILRLIIVFFNCCALAAVGWAFSWVLPCTACRNFGVVV